MLTSAKEIWDRLNESYEHKDVSSQVTLLKKLTNLSMDETTSVEKFLESWRNALDDVALSGLALPENVQAVMLLAALPSSWQAFISTKSAATLTVPTLIPSIMQEQTLRMSKNYPSSSSPTSGLAMFSRTPSSRPRNFRPSQRKSTSKPSSWRSKPKNFSSRPPFEVRKPYCKGCRVYGHSDKNCWNNKGKQKYNQAHYASGSNTESESEEGDSESYDSQSSTEDAHLCFSADTFSEPLPYNVHESSWLLDSGATCNLTYTKDTLTNYKPLRRPFPVQFGNKSTCLALGVGTAEILLSDGKIVAIHDVYYVPNIAKNLISVSHIAASGTRVEFGEAYATIKHQLPNGERYRVLAAKIWKLYLRHYRLGHLNHSSMCITASKQLAKNYTLPKKSKLSLCEGCLFGKLSQKKFPTRTTTTRKPLQIVHSDLCGPLPVPSLSHSHYFITFIDDFTRFSMVSFLKDKTSATVLQQFRTYQKLAENHFERSILTLQTDNGGIPPSFWEEAVSTPRYLQNRSYSRTIRGIPYFLWYGKEPDYSSLRIFGCTCYAFILATSRNKLDDRALKAIFVGYGEPHGVKGHRLYDPVKKDFLFSRSLVFDESSLISTPEETISAPSDDHGLAAGPSVLDSEKTKSPPSSESTPPTTVTWVAPFDPRAVVRHVPHPLPAPQALPPAPAIPLPEPAIQPITPSSNMPSTSRKITRSNHHRRSFTRSNYDNHMPYTRVLPPWDSSGPRSARTRHLHQSSPSAGLRPHQDTSHLSGQSHVSSQDPHSHSCEVPTFTPTSSNSEPNRESETPCTADSQKPPLRVKTRSLADLYNVTNPHQPHADDESFAGSAMSSEADPSEDGDPVSVEAALSRPSADLWHKAMQSELTSLNNNNNTWSLVPLPPGRQPDRSLGTLLLHQSSYVASLLKEFGLANLKPSHTPLPTGCKLSLSDCPTSDSDKAYMTQFPYRQLIGKMRYLVTGTRLDICYACNFLSKFMHNPGIKHWKALVRVARYLKSTSHLGICYYRQQSSQSSLLGWSDSD
ncbi:hypothetical protein L7F22_034187 [Adiantum nelumboides]|nr:hypothetical protein [Adiantum nelumboides]MCO5580321.1 hypothetical protein [Adiantum nelumboides]